MSWAGRGGLLAFLSLADDRADASPTGRIEHFIVSKAEAIIPESVRQKWHEYWHAVKEAENQQLGDGSISGAVEAAGCGVREAQERNEEEASKSAS